MEKLELEYKYAIGLHVMFYELKMLPFFVDSVVQAVKQVSNPENITVVLNLGRRNRFEEYNPEYWDKDSVEREFQVELARLLAWGVKIDHNLYEEEDLEGFYTMVNFRRDFNSKYCNKVDFLIWGETDCLIPKETFDVLEKVKDYTNDHDIYRYIVTFATRKMWDDSWKILEHPSMTNKPYLGRKNPDGSKNEESYLRPWSINYTMSLEEMNSINEETKEYDLRILQSTPKFDGSCLIISSDLVKAGANIPPGFWGISAEDTAFMHSCMQIMQQYYIQIVIKNILKVHNREHPLKRIGVITGQEESIQSNKGYWYHLMREMNKGNLVRFMQLGQQPFLTYEDFLEKLKATSNGVYSS